MGTADAMVSSQEQSWAEQVSACLQNGQLQRARSVLHHWMQHYFKHLPPHPPRVVLRQPLLWQALADVVERTGDQYLLELFWQEMDRVSLASTQVAASLPLLGIPILNRPDLLLRLLDGLDVMVDRLAIVDNSGGSAAEADVHQALTELEQSGHPRVRQIAVARPFANAGVAMSWNLILRSFPSAPVAALLNNDVRIAPGILAEALVRVDCSRAQFMPLLPVPQEFSAFLLTPGCWDRIGLFDPDFHPAYCEDLDYRDRLRRDSNVRWVTAKDLQDRMAALNPSSSATINSDPQLEAFNAISFALNRLWYLSHRRIRQDPRGTWIRQWLCEWTI